MAFKKWFSGAGSGGGDEDADLGVDDLVMLERFDDAVNRLKAKLKANPEDLHAHLKLAEVYTRMGKGSAAVEEFVFVAEEYARDGFYDKGIALLTKASRLNPLEETLPLKIGVLQDAKRLEGKRTAALEGFRHGAVDGGSGVELQQVWNKLAKGSLVQRLTEEHLRRIFGCFELERKEAGSLLAKRGEPGSRLWLIGRGGIVARLRAPDGKTYELRSFAAGDILGDAVLLERQVWPADYWVEENTLLFALSRPGLEKALGGNSDPRGLLDALRWQGNDRDVAAIARKLQS